MTTTTLFRRARKPVHSFCVGFLGGGVVGLVGWGGAQVIIPGMTMSPMNLSQLSATGVSLSCLSLSSVASGIKFFYQNSVLVDTTLAIAIPSLFSAGVGTYIAKRLSGDVLSFIFNGLSILLIPTHLWIQERRKQQESRRLNHKDDDTNNRNHSKDNSKHKHDNTHPTVREAEEELSNKYSIKKEQELLLQHSYFGLLSGLLSALMGVGGLPFTMSYLTEFTDLHHHHVQGTAICSVIPSLVTSAAFRINAIPMGTASVVAVGSMVGGVVGAQVALDLSEETLRKLYMASLVIFGGRSIVAATKNMKNIIQSAPKK